MRTNVVYLVAHIFYDDFILFSFHDTAIIDTRILSQKSLDHSIVRL